MLQMLTPETHEKQRRCGFRNSMDAHDCHKTIQKRNAQNINNPGKSIDGELAEQDHDAGDLIYSFGPMHLLHIDVGKIKKRSLSIDQQMVGANRTSNILY